MCSRFKSVGNTVALIDKKYTALCSQGMIVTVRKSR